LFGWVDVLIVLRAKWQELKKRKNRKNFSSGEKKFFGPKHNKIHRTNRAIVHLNKSLCEGHFFCKGIILNILHNKSKADNVFNATVCLQKATASFQKKY
jgi:hypothetical protein